MYLFLICLTFVTSLFAEGAGSQTVVENKTAESQAHLQKQVTDSKYAADRFLDEVDQGRYEDSWSKGAALLQQTMSKQEFTTLLNATRKPLGKVISRKLADVRIAHNPPGLPDGDYMVVIYNTVFSQNSKGIELVTLYNSKSGNWQVLTYSVK